MSVLALVTLDGGWLTTDSDIRIVDAGITVDERRVADITIGGNNIALSPMALGSNGTLMWATLLPLLDAMGWRVAPGSSHGPAEGQRHIGSVLTIPVEPQAQT